MMHYRLHDIFVSVEIVLAGGKQCSHELLTWAAAAVKVANQLDPVPRTIDKYEL